MSHVDSDDTDSVFCNAMPDFCDEYSFPEEEKRYESLFDFRDGVMKALEIARADKIIGKSLEASIVIYGKSDNEAMKLFSEFESELNTVFIVSKTVLSNECAPEGAYTDEESGISVAVSVAEGDKCVRCWMQSDDCTPDEDGQMLCERCRKSV